MHVKRLYLVNFKNYSEAEIILHSKLNCFVGNNGQGKTNLLDAIHYLCLCKSYFNNTDQFSIKNNEDFMLVQALFNREGKAEELHCGLMRNKKKQFRRNLKEYVKLSDHIGLFPVVMVSPSDLQLITEGSEERRKYLNGVISQFDKSYLESTINYNKILVQRNQILRNGHERKSTEELLDIYDEQLIVSGNVIYDQRKHFIKSFTPVFNYYYSFISGNTEDVELIYESQLHENDLSTLLKNSRGRDVAVQYTTAGIHKDDLTLNLNGHPIRKMGSQGQQKTYLVSLKMAQFEFLKNASQLQPILLLDDIFDKFDAHRVKHIVKLVTGETFGQIFITHTNLDRMKDLLLELDIDHKLFEVHEGQVSLLEG